MIHLFGFFATLITMWVLGPRSSASEVFGGFEDNAGWGNVGLAVILGQLSSVLSLSGADAATHMSEELRDASRTLPLAMIWTIVSNGLLGFIMLVTFCFMLGDVESVISSPTGQPHIQIMYNATQSKAGTSALAAITIAITLFGTVNMVTSCSRQTFAFARDNGLPYASFFSSVQHSWGIPLNSVIFSFIVSILLALINIGSTVAFNSIASLGTGALMSSYIISISCMFVKRWRNETLLPCKFSLGKSGIWINAISVLYLTFAFVVGFFPTFPHPTPDLMNWNVLIYGAVVVFSLVYYFIKGQYVYVGPVEYINKNM